MPGAMKGMLLGLANSAVVAFCIAMWLGDGDVLEATVIITMIAAIPSLFTGALLGSMAERMQTSNRYVLLISMIAISFAMVACLGTIFDLPDVILVSCVPTAAACSILERWTRAKPDEVFPIARVA
jgi:ABC-type cobalamin transport system permease subunit